MTLFEHVVIATDSKEIASLCQTLGAPFELTSSYHRSGTERVAEIANRDSYTGFDVIVNIQGDEPLVKESHVQASAELVATGAWPLATCATALHDDDGEDTPF